MRLLERRTSALADAGMFIQTTTGLATGALVFSVALVTTAQNIPIVAKIAITFSWLMLAVSIVFGILTRSMIPPMLETGKPNIRETSFQIQGRIHAGAFVLGCISIGIALESLLLSVPSTENLKVKNAARAIEISGETISSLPILHSRFTSVDLIKGADEKDPGADTWHVRYEIVSRIPSSSTNLDLFVDSENAAVSGFFEGKQVTWKP